MGGRNSCFCFNDLTEAKDWIIVNVQFPIGEPILPRSILDDSCYFHLRLSISEHPDSAVQLAEAEAKHIDSLYSDLGWPMRDDKAETAVTKLVFLGIGIDTLDQAVFIPSHKAEKYLAKVDTILNLQEELVSLKALRSIAGVLVYVSYLVPQCRTRLFHIFRCLKGAEGRLRRHVRYGGTQNPRRIFVGLDGDVRHDLHW